MRRIETWLVLLALAFYAWLLHRIGFNSVSDNLRRVGWGIGATIALEALARMANTLGWRAVIVDYPPDLSLGELFIARIAGEAVDYVTPSGQLGGQFVMALMIRRKLAMALGLASVIVAALAEMLGQIGFLTGAIATTLPYESRVHHLFWPVIGGMAIVLMLAGGFLFVQLRHPFSHLWRALTKFDFIRFNNLEIREAADQADSVLTEFYAGHRLRFALACVCYLMAWSLGPLEIFIYMRLLHQPVTWMVVLLIEALGQLIERATFLIPGKLISQEGGKALILSALGYPAGIGFTIGFLRRVKELIWVTFGLGGLAVHRLVISHEPSILNPAIELRKDARSA